MRYAPGKPTPARTPTTRPPLKLSSTLLTVSTACRVNDNWKASQHLPTRCMPSPCRRIAFWPAPTPAAGLGWPICGRSNRRQLHRPTPFAHACWKQGMQTFWPNTPLTTKLPRRGRGPCWVWVMHDAGQHRPIRQSWPLLIAPIHCCCGRRPLHRKPGGPVSAVVSWLCSVGTRLSP